MDWWMSVPVAGCRCRVYSGHDMVEAESGGDLIADLDEA
jgi:hypothetical protein